MSSILGSQVWAEATVRVGRGLFPLVLVLALVCLAAISPASAICQSSGKSCGLNTATNDRLCCPGTVCGWGNVCQPGCRINGVLYQNGAKNPTNGCQSCRPSVSTTRWSSLPRGTACGSSSSSVCDRADTCDGAGSCQSNFEPATTVCRQSAGQCDVAETCTGASGACPADGFASAGTACVGTSNGGACDGTDSCSGTANTCVDGFKTATTICRPSAGQCDRAEICSGTSGACPADGFAPPTTTCSDDDACTDGDACSNGSCVSGPPLVCDDGEDCTDDSCDGSIGCVFTPNPASCGACTLRQVCPGGPGPTCIELRVPDPPSSNTPMFTDGATVQTWPTPGVPGCLPDVTPNWPGSLVPVDSTAPVAPPIQTCYNDYALWVSSGRDVGAMAGKRWVNDLENVSFDAPAGKLFTSVGIVLECDLPANRLHDVQVYYYIAPGVLCEQQLIEPPLYAAKPNGGCNSYLLDTIPSDTVCAAGFRRIEIEPQIGSACRVVSTNHFRTASVP